MGVEGNCGLGSPSQRLLSPSMLPPILEASPGPVGMIASAVFTLLAMAVEIAMAVIASGCEWGGRERRSERLRDG